MSQDVTNCPRCERRTPAARGQCIYCGETLPFSRIQAAPPQRNIDSFEAAFNTVLEPAHSHPNESVTVAFAAALKAELSEAQAFIDSGKPLPLARSQTRQEADMIAALVRTCGLRPTVIPDDDLEIATELLRARRVEVQTDRIRVHHAGGDLTIPLADIKLLVLGMLRNTRVDYTERVARGESPNVVDTAEFVADEALVDVYTGALARSFRIKSDAFDYSGLVSQMSFRAEVNFKAGLAALLSAAPHARLDDDFARLRSLLARAWPERTRSEARGVKRSGIALRSHASLISDNRDQFNRYSRLMFLWSK
ncbi:MAG TPA: hypothetical protein VNS63_05060 [Blastocatellia bacterium]|nr:hypothetical protein [Blastocatellia bacterium]